MKGYKYYPMITGLFSACLVISNILDTKIFIIGSLDFPGGIILFPIVYLFADILTEVYGYANSRKVIWTGFISLALMTLASLVVQSLKPASFWNYQKEFDDILGKIPRIVAASFTAYFCGEFANSYILAKMKVKTEGRGMPLRFVISTIVGEFFDTAVFIVVAFAGTMSWTEALTVLLSAWVFKVGWEILALPLTLPVVRWLKKTETADYFDRHTNFNPFKITT